MDIRTGSEAFVAYQAEAGMIAPDETSVPSAAGLGTFILAGYTNVAGFSRPNALRRLRAAGMARPVPKPRPSRRNPTVSVPMTVSGGTNFRNLLEKALRKNAPASDTYKCLPVFALALPTRTVCGEGTVTQELARFCQFNTCTINISQDAYVTATSDIWPLFIDPVGGGTMPTVTDADIVTAGGNPFVFEDMSFFVGANEYTAWVQSISISINNMLTRISSRDIIQGFPLAFAPRVIVSTGEEINITLNLFDRLPELEIGGAGTGGIYGDDMGPVTILLNDGTESLSFATTADFMDTTGQQEGEPTAPISYSASMLSADLTIA